MLVPSNAIPNGPTPTAKVPSVAPVGDCAVARTLLQAPGFRDATGARGARQSGTPGVQALQGPASPQSLSIMQVNGLETDEDALLTVVPPAPDAPEEDDSDVDEREKGKSVRPPHPAPIAIAAQTMDPPNNDIPTCRSFIRDASLKLVIKLAIDDLRNRMRRRGHQVLVRRGASTRLTHGRRMSQTLPSVQPARSWGVSPSARGGLTPTRLGFSRGVALGQHGAERSGATRVGLGLASEPA
jgi:hypothetical protein